MVFVVHECWTGSPELRETSCTWMGLQPEGCFAHSGKCSGLRLLNSAGGWALSSPLATTKGGRQSLRLGFLLTPE